MFVLPPQLCYRLGMSPRLTFTLTATAMLASCGTPNRAPDDALRSRDAKIAQQARRIAELEATADRNRRDAAANGAVQGMTDALNSSDAKEQLADAEVRAEDA